MIATRLLAALVNPLARAANHLLDRLGSAADPARFVDQLTPEGDDDA